MFFEPWDEALPTDEELMTLMLMPGLNVVTRVRSKKVMEVNGHWKVGHRVAVGMREWWLVRFEPGMQAVFVDLNALRRLRGNV